MISQYYDYDIDLYSECPILSYCPAGTTSEKTNFIQVTFGGLAIILAVAAWKFFVWYRDRQRKRREEIRSQIAKKKKKVFKNNIPSEDEEVLLIEQPSQGKDINRMEYSTFIFY
jgi:hypothetical protein